MIERFKINDAYLVAEAVANLDARFFGKESKKYSSDLCNLAKICALQGDNPKARAMLEEAIRIDEKFVEDPDYEMDRGITHLLIAFVLDELGENSESRHHANQALKLIPSSRINGMAGLKEMMERCRRIAQNS